MQLNQVKSFSFKWLSFSQDVHNFLKRVDTLCSHSRHNLCCVHLILRSDATLWSWNCILNLEHSRFLQQDLQALSSHQLDQSHSCLEQQLLSVSENMRAFAWELDMICWESGIFLCINTEIKKQENICRCINTNQCVLSASLLLVSVCWDSSYNIHSFCFFCDCLHFNFNFISHWWCFYIYSSNFFFNHDLYHKHFYICCSHCSCKIVFYHNCFYIYC